MHDSAKKSFIKFSEVYLNNLKNPKIIDLGSLDNDGNGSIKELINFKSEYIGVDVSSGNNVDIVLKDPYKFPFEDNSIDAIVSISAFEHTKFFWLSYLEILRVLKPEGLFFLNAPSNSDFHRHDTDSWRFYPDSGLTLIDWANKNNYDPEVLEHYTSNHNGKERWNDYVCVTIKDKKYVKNYQDRILDSFSNYRNGRTNRSDKLLNYNKLSQDQDNLGWFIYFKLRKFIQKLKIFKKNNL